MRTLIVILRSALAVYLSTVILVSCTSSNDDVNQGRALLREGKSREALTALNQAVEADADNADAFNTRGVAYFELKEYSNALLDYEQALKLKPNFYRPYYNRALLKTSQGDVQAALSDYSEAIRNVPEPGAVVCLTRSDSTRPNRFQSVDQAESTERAGPLQPGEPALQ
jgi:Flp pilus assembly protein TadD